MKAVDLFELQRAFGPMIRDIVREEMRALLSAVKEKPGTWKCPWCHKPNNRKHAGRDKCDHCGAIVFTQFGAASDIVVKSSQNPRHLDRASKQICFDPLCEMHNKSKLSGGEQHG